MALYINPVKYIEYWEEDQMKRYFVVSIYLKFMYMRPMDNTRYLAGTLRSYCE
jgi:uncharacterized membrane protein YkgB